MNTQTSQQPKKPLPYSVNKDELVGMYLDQFPESEITQKINLIITSYGGSKFRKSVPHREFMEFVETYGLPKDYFNPDDNK